MAAFHRIRTHRLVVLLLQFLLGNSYLLLPADPAAAGWTDLYPHVVLLSVSLLLSTVVAAAVLLSAPAIAANSSAEAKPAAAACKQGSVTSLSVERRLHALLAFAIILSAASVFVAVATFEFGFEYRRGRVSVLCGWPAGVLLSIMWLEHVLYARYVSCTCT